MLWVEIIFAHIMMYDMIWHQTNRRNCSIHLVLSIMTYRISPWDLYIWPLPRLFFFHRHAPTVPCFAEPCHSEDLDRCSPLQKNFFFNLFLYSMYMYFSIHLLNLTREYYTENLVKLYAAVWRFSDHSVGIRSDQCCRFVSRTLANIKFPPSS